MNGLNETRGMHWFGQMLAGGVGAVLDAYAVTQERRRLRDLDWRALEDIGIRPEEARREMRKPFWSGRRHC